MYLYPPGYRTVVFMPVNRRSDRTYQNQVADKLRDDILSGQLKPGAKLPSEAQLAGAAECGREVVRQALGMLRHEALIRTERGVGSLVRETPVRTPLRLKRGETATLRMPTEPERREMDWDEGVPMLIVKRANGSEDILQADTVTLTG